MEKHDLLIGIDLGTSRTSVVSSRGARITFDSVVGFPKDVIGVRLLGSTYAVGDEVLDKGYLDLQYPLEDGVLKESGDQDTARKLLEYAIAQAEPNEGERVCAIIGVPADASGVNQSRVLELVRDMVDVAMVTSEPFLVAFGLEKLINSIVIDVGAGTVDICGLKGGIPRSGDQNSLTKAGDFIDDLLLKAISSRYPGAKLTKRLVKEIKEAHAFVGKPEQPVEVTLREAGKPVLVDITEELRHACEAIVPEILEYTEKLIAGFDPMDQAEALQNIILAGGGSKITGLAQMVANGLSDYGDVNVSNVQDVVYAGCDGALKLARELPPEYWSQIGATT
ncbi:rod shape-determining protein [Magnetovirga frankeli]|uniref:MamK family actin-like protein n=1 Tax=Magnetovirga frankeli TaxID=947516 RepID=UPI00029D0DB4|nr:magnetosome protein [gamma proteobacterium SS-5]QFY89634.1 rod shape-determining protein [gamma proteobacterium SS-5]